MARKGQSLAFLTGTLTQGSNDAFIQLTLATALFGQTRSAYRLASLECEIPAFFTAASDVQLALTRKSYAAMPTSMFLEKSCIHYYRESGTFTTSGQMHMERTKRWTWNDADAPIIVEDPIYLQFDSAATGASNSAYFRLGYWIDSISEVDRLQLIANSLS